MYFSELSVSLSQNYTYIYYLTVFQFNGFLYFVNTLIHFKLNRPKIGVGGKTVGFMLYSERVRLLCHFAFYTIKSLITKIILLRSVFGCLPLGFKKIVDEIASKFIVKDVGLTYIFCYTYLSF